jgi:hypothetical protein
MKHHKKSRGQSLVAVLFALFFVSVGFFLAAVQAQAGNGTLAGIVRGSSGVLAGQWVDIFDCNTANPDYTHGYITSVQTGSNGGYTIALPEGVSSYRVAVVLDPAYVDYWYKDLTSPVGAQCVTVPANGTTTLNDIVLVTADTSGSISGTVTNTSSAAIPGVVVYAWNSTGGAQTATTNAAGFYNITGLQPGNYKVEFVANNAGYVTKWHYDKETKSTADPVTVVTGTATPNINATLDAGGNITGKVRFGSSTGPVIANAWVDVYDSTGTTRKSYAKTDSNGIYTAGGLPTTGTYIVKFHEKTVLNTGAGATLFFSQAQALADATAVPAPHPNTDAFFPGSVIEGTITKGGGVGIAGVTVTLYDSSGMQIATLQPTLDDGKYSFPGLLAGSYKLYFDATGTDYASEWYDGKKISFDDATSILVTELAMTVTINVDLDKKANLAPVYNLLLMKERTP